MVRFYSARCAAAVFCVMLSASPAQATPATESFIQLNLDKVGAILGNISLTDDERHEQIRTLLLSVAASRRIALFTLGPYATGAAPQDVEAFVDALTNYSVLIYENALDHYRGQVLKVLGSSDRATDDSLVQAEILNPNTTTAPPIKLAFRVRRDENGASVITDIQIEGVSFASAQRADFTAYLQQHNGSIPELVRNLNALSNKLAPKGETLSAGN